MKKKWKVYGYYPKRGVLGGLHLIPNVNISIYPDSECTSPFVFRLTWLYFGFVIVKINWNHYCLDDNLTMEQKRDLYKNRPKVHGINFTFPISIWLHYSGGNPILWAMHIHFLFWSKMFTKMKFKD